jgi:hypothetical protein
MRSLASVRSELQKHGIRDGCDYAEAIVAEAVGGIRKPSGVNKGLDIQSSLFGRIEVKCRQLPRDGRIEERVSLGNTKEGGFDHLAVVVFKPDFEVKGAVLVPYWRVWDFVQANPYGRISYAQACRLSDAVDITAAVVAAAKR